MAHMSALLASLAPQLNYDFSLVVVQESKRARMAGFGDRDRRPLTPPLICKLVATDRKTGRAVPVDEIDTSFFMMAADLQTEDGQDANLIRHPNAFGHNLIGSPQMYMAGGYPLGSGYTTPYGASAATSAAPSVASPSSSLHESDSPKEDDARSSGSRRSSAGAEEAKQVRASGMARSAAGAKEEVDEQLPTPPEASSSRCGHPSNPSTQFPSVFDDSAPNSPDPHNKRRRLSSSASQSQALLWHSNNYPTPSALRSQLLAPPPNATNVYLPHGSERDYAEPAGTTVPNLIGALHTNAFKLKDDRGEKGIFFIFHDLSVRTEGRFRLRLRFLAIGAGGRRGEGGSAVVARTHSQAFSVSSAKKFEGMMDPTPLSQCMAKQGVRIPTRKVARTKSASSVGGAGGTKRKAKGSLEGEEDELEDEC